MQFGGRQLPMPLRVARMLVYLQVVLLVMIAAFVVITAFLVGGSSNNVVNFAGNFALSVANGTAYLFAAVQLIICVILILAVVEADKGNTYALYLLVGAEVIVALYILIPSPTSLVSWIFGPVLGAAVIWLHYMKESSGYLAQLRTGTPARTESASAVLAASGRPAHNPPPDVEAAPHPPSGAPVADDPLAQSNGDKKGGAGGSGDGAAEETSHQPAPSSEDGSADGDTDPESSVDA